MCAASRGPFVAIGLSGKSSGRTQDRNQIQTHKPKKTAVGCPPTHPAWSHPTDPNGLVEALTPEEYGSSALVRPLEQDLHKCWPRSRQRAASREQTMLIPRQVHRGDQLSCLRTEERRNPRFLLCPAGGGRLVVGRG